jgi:hypothetical protein
VSTFPVENRTRTYQPRQGVYLRRGPFDDRFDCQLPEEARTELLEEIPPQKTYRIREIPAYQPAPPPPPEVVYRPRAVPISKTPPPAKRSHGATVIGTVAIAALFLYAVSHNNGPSTSTAPPESRSGPTPSSQPVEVRWALPGPVEVRRALPVVPRALPVTGPVSLVPDPTTGQWQPVTLLDGRTTVQACYQGELPSSAALPPQGCFIGEEWSNGNTSWIWMTPAGASFPSWVDP